MRIQKTVIEIGKPNILFIVVDCFNADAIFEENTYKPTIDGLIDESITLKNTIVPATSTIPSFSSLFTGEYPPDHGVRAQSGYKLKRSSPNMIESFRMGGYNTYAEVTGPLMEEFGFDRGFDHYRCRDRDENVSSDWFKNLIDALENDRFKDPWFLMLHFWEMHGPRTFPPEFDDPKYGANDYEKALAFLDSKLKRILDRIDLENTIVVITGDHGELYGKTRMEEITLHTAREFYKIKRKLGMKTDNLMPGDHGFHVYDFLIRVPLIIHIDEWEGKEIDEQCRNIDILPTLLDYLDIPIDFDIDGKSLLPMIKHEKDLDLIAYSESTGSILGDVSSKKFCSIRTNCYKYMTSPNSENKKKDILIDISNQPEIRDMTKSTVNRWLLYLFPNLIINKKENIIEEKPDVAEEMREIFDDIYRGEEEKKIERAIESVIKGI